MRAFDGEADCQVSCKLWEESRTDVRIRNAWGGGGEIYASLPFLAGTAFMTLDDVG